MLEHLEDAEGLAGQVWALQAQGGSAEQHVLLRAHGFGQGCSVQKATPVLVSQLLIKAWLKVTPEGAVASLCTWDV